MLQRSAISSSAQICHRHLNGILCRSSIVSSLRNNDHYYNIFQAQNRFYAQEARIKAIVLQDYDGRFFKGDVVTVKAGFMRNELYPKKVCVYATKENMQKLEGSMTDEMRDELEEKKRGARLIRYLGREKEPLEMKRITSDHPLQGGEKKPAGIYGDMVYMLDQPVTKRDLFESILLTYPDIADTLSIADIELPEGMTIDRTGIFAVPVRVSKFDVFEISVGITRREKLSEKEESQKTTREQTTKQEKGMREMTEEEMKAIDEEMMGFSRMSDKELTSGFAQNRQDLETMEKLKKGMEVDDIVKSMSKPRDKKMKKEEREKRKKEIGRAHV